MASPLPRRDDVQTVRGAFAAAAEARSSAVRRSSRPPRALPGMQGGDQIVDVHALEPEASSRRSEGEGGRRKRLAGDIRCVRELREGLILPVSPEPLHARRADVAERVGMVAPALFTAPRSAARNPVTEHATPSAAAVTVRVEEAHVDEPEERHIQPLERRDSMCLIPSSPANSSTGPMVSLSPTRRMPWSLTRSIGDLGFRTSIDHGLPFTCGFIRRPQ